VNDLYSFDKEKRDEAKGAIMVNAVDVLQRSRKIPVDEAKISTRKDDAARRGSNARRMYLPSEI
jgi:hypothetical protein